MTIYSNVALGTGYSILRILEIKNKIDIIHIVLKGMKGINNKLFCERGTKYEKISYFE